MSQQTNANGWRFFLDAGGTFTDCIAIPVDGPPRRKKVLSSGHFRGVIDEIISDTRVSASLPDDLPDGFFTGWQLRCGDDTALVADSATNTLVLEGAMTLRAGDLFDLSADVPAPIVAIRLLSGLPLSRPIGRASIRLGTTRATNALLENKLSPTALVTTLGFVDLPEIGTQARPDLFALTIKKPELLHRATVAVDERIATDGNVLKSLNASAVREQLQGLRAEGIESLAIALMNSWTNPDHEEQIATIAEAMGFVNVSVSSRLSRSIGLLDRMNTTIADACLSPVLDAYIRQIRDAAPEAELLLMTSAGALAPPGRFSGRDAVLSGPAGGVVGLSRVSQQAGIPDVIGFDMGGTSTDVSRYAGAPEYEMVTEKAGLRIVAPTLAVHTVAAGGGSICGFDGQRLTVGPESAGADPGPACYGRGGPLSITDLNLFTGRVDPQHFPFPLDLHAVESRLEAICTRVLEAGGLPYSHDALAAAYLKIANEKMAAAIHRISTTRGCAPEAHALVSFGGAAAQHACAIADLLNISTIIQHPDASILSAVGIGAASIRRFSDRSVLQRLSKQTLNQLQADLTDDEQMLRDELRACGASPSSATLTITLDLRYEGEKATIPVLFRPDQIAPRNEGEACGREPRELRAIFEAEHMRRNGHVQPDRDVEIAVLRLELAAATDGWDDIAIAPKARQSPVPIRSVLFGETRLPTEIWELDEVLADTAIVGPAIIYEPRSAVVVPPGWKAIRHADGLMHLHRTTQAEHREVIAEHGTDPATLELFANRFSHVATDMGLALQRSAISVNVRDRLDFSCAILDARGQLIVNAPHIPVHLGAMGDAVKALLAAAVSLQPGDAWLVNDPDLGGSHLPDLTVITPIFSADDTTLLFFTASRAHHAEIGGSRPGSCFPFPKSLAEEGVLFRHFLLLRDATLREAALLEALTSPPYPSRSPQENLADLRAQIAANHRGVEGIRNLIAQSGAAQVIAYAHHLCAAAEQQSRQTISRIPDDVYRFQDQLDSGATIQVAITVAGENMTVDFAGTGPVNSDSLNANPSIVRSALLYCLRCLIDAPVPLNDGVLAPVDLHIPESFLAPPAHADPAQRAPTAGGNTEVSQRVVDVILGALGIAAASQGTMNNLIFGNQRFGYYETVCGGAGATSVGPGASAVHTHMTNTRITDPERFEHAVPARLLAFSVHRDSGGNGLHPGGDGILRIIEFLSTLELSLLTQRRTTAPFGLAGGGDGKPGENLIVRRNGDRCKLGPLAQTTVNNGDRLTLKTPGGGGYGMT